MPILRLLTAFASWCSAVPYLISSEPKRNRRQHLHFKPTVCHYLSTVGDTCMSGCSAPRSVSNGRILPSKVQGTVFLAGIVFPLFSEPMRSDASTSSWANACVFISMLFRKVSPLLDTSRPCRCCVWNNDKFHSRSLISNQKYVFSLSQWPDPMLRSFDPQSVANSSCMLP
jgi:hypothetical protein